jgi:hypothetical protein
MAYPVSCWTPAFVLGISVLGHNLGGRGRGQNPIGPGPGKIGFPMARKASGPASALLELEVREFQKQRLSKNHKVLLSQFHHSLKSPQHLQHFINSIDVDQWFPWLSSKPEKDQKSVKHWLTRFLKESYFLYAASSPEARDLLLHLLQSWFILFMQNPLVAADFASHIVKEDSRRLGAEQAGQASPGESTQSPKWVRRENQRAHESLNQTFKRLHRKYGRDQFMITAHQVDEEANGIQHQAMAKNIPVKYMTIGQAAEKFQIANDTLATWLADGLLLNVTKVQHPANPESGIILVEPREVAKLKEKVGLGDEAAEPKLITLVEAAKKYDLPYETIRTWYRSGRLPEKGREVFSTHGGGKILVDENEITRLMNRRTPKKKSPSKPAE